MDIRVPMEPIARAFGVDVAVRPEFREPANSTGIWLPPDMNDLPPAAGQQRIAPKKVMALLRTDVPSAPRGTRIDAPEIKGAEVKAWVVDAIDRVDQDEIRVVLIEKELFP